jgi:asparagine synthase (glutamine-hydrolysing)
VSLHALDGPYISYGHSETFAGKAFLADAGFSGVLNGHGGDEIVSYGAGRLNELAIERKWLELWRQTEPLSRLHNISRWKLFSPYLSHIYKIRLFRRYLARWNQQALANLDLRAILTDEGKWLVQERSGGYKNPSLISYDDTERSLHEEAVTSPLYARAFEVTAIASAAAGVETLMPFCDRDLVEYSVSLPSETKLGGGFTRRILREAMRGRVPETVRTRFDKYEFTSPFVNGLLSVNSRMDDLIDAHTGVLADLVDMTELQRLRSDVVRNGKGISGQGAFSIWRILVAAKWMEIMKSQTSSRH